MEGAGQCSGDVPPHMKAMVLTKFGPPDVLQLQEVAKPAPKDHEVLIRIYATTVTAGDCELRSLKVPLAFRLPLRIYVGLIRPKPMILGQELAGEIEAVGKEVTRFRQGDQVFAWTGLGLGAYSESTAEVRVSGKEAEGVSSFPLLMFLFLIFCHRTSTFMENASAYSPFRRFPVPSFPLFLPCVHRDVDRGRSAG